MSRHASLILRGGGIINDVTCSLDTLIRAREQAKNIGGDPWLTVQWQPGHTPDRPDSFKLHVLIDEVIGVKVRGR